MPICGHRCRAQALRAWAWAQGTGPGPKVAPAPPGTPPSPPHPPTEMLKRTMLFRPRTKTYSVDARSSTKMLKRKNAVQVLNRFVRCKRFRSHPSQPGPHTIECRLVESAAKGTMVLKCGGTLLRLPRPPVSNGRPGDHE